MMMRDYIFSSMSNGKYFHVTGIGAANDVDGCYFAPNAESA